MTLEPQAKALLPNSQAPAAVHHVVTYSSPTRPKLGNSERRSSLEIVSRSSRDRPGIVRDSPEIISAAPELVTVDVPASHGGTVLATLDGKVVSPPPAASEDAHEAAMVAAHLALQKARAWEAAAATLVSQRKPVREMEEASAAQAEAAARVAPPSPPPATPKITTLPSSAMTSALTNPKDKEVTPREIDEVNFEITVPVHVQPGDLLHATTPSGVKVQLAVPEGAVPGTALTFSLPASFDSKGQRPTAAVLLQARVRGSRASSSIGARDSASSSIGARDSAREEVVDGRLGRSTAESVNVRAGGVDPTDDRLEGSVPAGSPLNPIILKLQQSSRASLDLASVPTTAPTITLGSTGVAPTTAPTMTPTMTPVKMPEKMGPAPVMTPENSSAKLERVRTAKLAAQQQQQQHQHQHQHQQQHQHQLGATDASPNNTVLHYRSYYTTRESPSSSSSSNSGAVAGTLAAPPIAARDSRAVLVVLGPLATTARAQGSSPDQEHDMTDADILVCQTRAHRGVNSQTPAHRTPSAGAKPSAAREVHFGRQPETPASLDASRGWSPLASRGRSRSETVKVSVNSHLGSETVQLQPRMRRVLSNDDSEEDTAAVSPASDSPLTSWQSSCSPLTSSSRNSPFLTV